MKFALQRCCTTPILLKQYETSTDAVLKRLGVQLLDRGLNCCGYPLKNVNFRAHVLASSRNLSIAEKKGLDIMTFCNCCYGTLRHVNHLMKHDVPLRDRINETLQRESLSYNGGAGVKHMMEVFHQEIGLDRIKACLVKRYKGARVAIHYGCHMLRPRELVQLAPTGTAMVFDGLVEATGAECVSWPSQLECCGSAMWGIDDSLSMDLAEKKVKDALRSGAEFLCLACSYCQLQFDRVQERLLTLNRIERPIPSILYTQLLGLCLGLDDEVLGIHKNRIDISGIKRYLSTITPENRV